MLALPHTVRVLPAAHARNLPQQEYEIKKYEKFYSKGVLINHTKISTNEKISRYTVASYLVVHPVIALSLGKQYGEVPYNIMPKIFTNFHYLLSLVKFSY